MKTPSLDLFELIHSFSIYERRTFIELFSNTNNKDKNYLLLFREICKQKQYDETILKKKFKNNIYFKQLKSNLYGIMLRFINYSSIHKNDYQEIHAMLQRFEQLFHKKLFSILKKK